MGNDSYASQSSHTSPTSPFPIGTPSTFTTGATSLLELVIQTSSAVNNSSSWIGLCWTGYLASFSRLSISICRVIPGKSWLSSGWCGYLPIFDDKDIADASLGDFTLRVIQYGFIHTICLTLLKMHYITQQ